MTIDNHSSGSDGGFHDDDDKSRTSSSSLGRSTGAATPTESLTNHTRSRSLQLQKPEDSSTESTAMAISPRSSKYDRLDGGMGPSRMNNKRIEWKKFALAGAAIIGLVWFFSPRESVKTFSWPSDKEESEIVYTSPPHDVDPPPPPPPLDSDVKKPVSSSSHPTSFEEDPDPSKTTHCTAPYAPHLPLVQYALMIDAGSTGSRIHIYKFNNCGSSPSYEYEVFKQRQPGLSSYAGKPNEAATSLDVLLDKAVEVVPAALRSCTPVAVKATAGLRLLPGSQSKDILDAVTRRIIDEYPFKLHEPDGVVVMDGKDEGVYAWITANYLLSTIRADTPSNTPTYAVLDLGGASTQIVFEPTFTKSDGNLEEGEHKYLLDFGGKEHTLYQHSYLGYGLMKARAHVHQLVDFMASIRNPGQGSLDTVPPTIGNPCLARGTKRNVDIKDDRTNTTKTVVMDGEQIGSFEACNRVIELVMAKDAICEVKPCSFNGVYQPSLLDSFVSGNVLLLSYFFDRIDPLSSEASTDKLTVSTIASLAKDVCLGRDVWITRWGSDSKVMAELEDRPEWCLDLTFMHGLLRLGYEFSDERDVVIGKKIQDTELGWCLGATIAMVGGDLKCRTIA
jgi:guanosine-diphosphatase